MAFLRFSEDAQIFPEIRRMLANPEAGIVHCSRDPAVTRRDILVFVGEGQEIGALDRRIRVCCILLTDNAGGQDHEKELQADHQL